MFQGFEERKIYPNRSDLGILKERNKGNRRGLRVLKEGKRLEGCRGPEEGQIEGNENFGVSKKNRWREPKILTSRRTDGGN